MSLFTYYHTLRYLKAEQIFFQVYYKLGAKLRNLLGRRPDYGYYKQGYPLLFVPFPEKCTSYMGDDMFCFLNLTHRFVGVWDDRSHGDLWRYNLNYMDFLLQPSMGADEGYQWISRYIDAVVDNKIAADQYPISLRGINWIKFVSLHQDKFSEEQRKRIDSSLYSQYRILYKRMERHLLANHYLENAFSLLFAAIYFRDEVFWKKAESVLNKQLKEQILCDGAHYELSPMYHCIILERLLDCCNLLTVACREIFFTTESLLDMMREKASLMLSWLDAIVVADDSIPLLNDAAYGIALSPMTLRDYAISLGITWTKGELRNCGYRHVIFPDYEAIVDMAQLGVSYNLGHAHADSATFLLWVRGKALLVDTGTSTYNLGTRREYERSTRAHNTVVIDGCNSSKVWSAFRCAQRACSYIEKDGVNSFVVRHDGYADKKIQCVRSYECREKSFELLDRIEGIDGFKFKAEAYFHLSPDVKILKIDDNRVVTDRAVFVFEGYDSLHLESVEIAEEYNRLQSTQCIRVCFKHLLHTIIRDFR